MTSKKDFDAFSAHHLKTDIEQRSKKYYQIRPQRKNERIVQDRAANPLKIPKEAQFRLVKDTASEHSFC